MKKSTRIRNAFRGLIDAVSRFPLTSLFLLLAAIMESIYQGYDFVTEKYFATLIVGALLGAVTQIAYERFFDKSIYRLVLTGIAALMTIGYYIIILPAPKMSTEIEIRTIIALFALLISFIWIPSIKRKTSFNECFMATFKGFFISLFFALVLYAGISLIINATDELLFRIDFDIYDYVGNAIFIVFAPIYFLSIIPGYNIKAVENDDEESFEERNRLREEKISKAISCPKYLEILLSYIIIPLTAVFTLILVIYIIINIGNDFWSDNLLEPMFITYSITVIIVYILTSNLDNKFATLFRKIFPKVLIPIAAFQTIASIIKIQDVGITHNRYFVIIYGIFAIAAGLIFSVVHVRKNGIIAAILIVISAITMIPPVDAFTLSRNNQMAIAEKVLLNNNMLQNNSIIKKDSIPLEDRQKLVNALEYLHNMDYTDRVPYLSSDFNYYQNFNETFGFSQYDKDHIDERYSYLTLEENSVLDISNYDFMTTTIINIPLPDSEVVIGNISKAGKDFSIKMHNDGDDCIISLENEAGDDIISVSTKDIFDKLFEQKKDQKDTMSAAEATYNSDNTSASLTIIIDNINMHVSSQNYYNADVLVMIKINQ